MLDIDGKAYSGTESMIGEQYTTDLTVDATQKGKKGAELWIDTESGIKAYDVQIPYYENDQLMGSICIGLSLERMDKAIENHIRNGLTMTALTGVVAALCVLFIVRILIKPLNVLSTQLLGIAKGDFTIEQDAKILKQKDELGIIARSVQSMRLELSRLISTLKINVNSVGEGANQLTEIMDETSKSIEEKCTCFRGFSRFGIKPV